MKNISKYLIFILTGVTLTLSCYKDNGNYDYTTVTDIKIDTIGMPNRLDLNSVEIGKRLNLKPNITYGRELDKLSYYWIIYPYYYSSVQEGNAIVWPQADTISHSQELDWIVDADPGQYNMQFVAVDPENGMKSFFWFYLNVPSKGTKSGLYILSEYDGKTDVDLYGSARGLIIGGDHFTPKYYSSLHGGEMLNGKPLFISYSNNYYYVFTEQEGKRLSPNGLQIIDDFNQMFYTAPVYRPQNHIYTNNCEFIINDGKLHVMYTNKVNDRKFSAPVAGNYDATPFLAKMTRTTYNPVVGAIGSDQVIFDKLQKGFRPYFPQAVEVSHFKETVPNAFVNINNMGSEPIASIEANGGQIYNIMRTNGKDSLIVIRFYNVVDDGDLSVGGNSRVSLQGCEGISQAKYFASSTAGSAFFYATDKAVYSFSYTSGQTQQVDIYRCAADEEVTCLYQMPSGGFPTSGCVLWVGIWNTTTKVGSLREYEIDPTSGSIRTYWTNMFAPHLSNPSITTGLGKIKSMVIKM
jgi:hypothetical protein